MANAISSFREIVGRVPKLNIRSKQQPIGAWFPERHSHTAGIHNSNLCDRSVELHVGMTAYDHTHVQPFKDWQEAVFRCKTSKYLSVISRRGVAELHLAQPANLYIDCFGPASQQTLVLGIELLRYPAKGVSSLFRNGDSFRACHLRNDLAVAVAFDKLYWNIEVQQTRECLTRHWAQNYIAPNDYMVYVRLANVSEYSLERGQVSMNIIECSNPHDRLTNLQTLVARCALPRNHGQADQ